jgi:membrane associated rhomboid family serine protease
VIPLKDSTRSGTIPFVNLLLIGINIAVFIYQLSLSSQELNQFILNYGVIPSQLPLWSIPFHLLTNPMALFPLVSATFMHGSLFHIGGNMLYLWVFGDNVEDRLGHFRYLLFYFLVAFIGHFAHIFTNPGSNIPTIGASGAVAGVLGAYFLAFPKAKILALIPLGIFLTVTTVPAVLFLFLWFILQLINGIIGGVGAVQTVAWWAHIGGFIGGAVLYKIFKKRSYREIRY